jgi:hypothetical protein
VTVVSSRLASHPTITMDRKRKLPPRAAARVEQAAKKRNVTPQERSVTPATPQPVKEPSPPPPPPLPKSVQPGKPLPTVEEAQPDGLSAKEYQSVSESGVLAESLSRSRQKWISEGLFEKYWTKPHKRKGVITEDPKNPPKDSMSKIGTVTIIIEPHMVEATMYAVKDPKPRTQTPQAQQQSQSKLQARPIIQYGPLNGSMPPPPAPGSVAASPTLSASGAPKPEAPSPVQASPRPLPVSHNPQPGQPAGPLQSPKPSNSAAAAPNISSPSPSATQAQTVPPQPQAHAQVLPQAPAASPSVASPSLVQSPAANPSPAAVSRPTPTNAPIKPAIAGAPPSPAAAGATSNLPRPQAASGLAKPAGPAGTAGIPAKAPATSGSPKPGDPVIALLAQKASNDAELRGLMRRVAVGQAKDGELAQFQKIIDQLNAECKRKAAQQAPRADQLMVDGRTVKYFADEVRMILDIVLSSNPHQKANELIPPPKSDPLVVLLVKKALDDSKTGEMVRRVAAGHPLINDPSELKDMLDKLHREIRPLPAKQPSAAPATPVSRQPVANGAPNGHAKASTPNSQALRSKGPPPPAPKPDISAVVFDFGSGDRYLFPKFSILEYLHAGPGQQVVASFLIVRKGSTSEYGGDPKLDYYQPITVRFSTATGRHLDNLARVVAPQDEVRRYMNDVMDNMTRAEYVLLAMQLPRPSKDGELDGGDDQVKTRNSTPKADGDAEQTTASNKPSVLWGNSTAVPTSRRARLAAASDAEDEEEMRYHKLIKSVTSRDKERN